MSRKEYKMTIITGVFLLVSLISGGAAAIASITEGLVYDILYAIHKIISILAAILFLILLMRLRKKQE